MWRNSSSLLNGLESRGLDLGAVNEKLCNFTEAPPASPRSSFSSSLTPDPNDPALGEEDRLDRLHWEHKAYHDLVQDGGRPSHRPDNLGFDYLYEPQVGIVWYWITVCPCRECIFKEQRAYWEEFRKHQDWRRWRYWKPEWFNRFVQDVRDYRRKKGLGGDICLRQDRKEQSRLEDWVEFQYWEYRKADWLVKERELYAEKVKGQMERLQAAIDAGQPADKITMIRDHSLVFMRGRRDGAEIELARQDVLLEWIDEQLPIIASECQKKSVMGTHILNDYESPPASTNLGERKRLADETGDVKDNCRRVEFAELCETESSLVKDADIRDSRMLITRHRRRRNAHLEACANSDTIHTLEISGPVYRRSLLKLTNSTRRHRTRMNPVQTPGERLAVRAGLNTSGFGQQPAATPAEEEITFQKSKVELATSQASSKRRSSTAPAPQSTTLGRVHSSRVSKAREPARIQASPEVAYRDDARRSTRKGKLKEKPAAPRNGKNSAKGRRKKRHLANAPVRKSPRLEGKPEICYSR